MASEIDNPEFKEDFSIGKYAVQYVGLDVWQKEAGTEFGDVMVTDDEEEAESGFREEEEDEL